ncbi:hypothetical protein JCM13304A_04790 [Desulfothermus okinawensis JCM 13304]
MSWLFYYATFIQQKCKIVQEKVDAIRQKLDMLIFFIMQSYSRKIQYVGPSYVEKDRGRH